jgi:hypothetical protein
MCSRRGKISPAVTLPTVYTSGIGHSGMDQLSFVYEPETSHSGALIRVIWTAKAEPPSGRAVEWNGKDVLGEYRAGGRALCRPLTLGLTPSHCPNGPAGERGKHGAKLASRSAYYQLFPRGRAWRTQHTLSLPASAAPAQVCTDSPAPCIREASACRAAAPSHAGLPRTRSDATGG